ncbi:MAG: 5-formyltetrahydrofolate cyclo-ligase [Proteobacteria bacterium]|nr:5-formyltetrahydrofolate cyclo-ligase [Pseudomonadota bacterium]
MPDTLRQQKAAIRKEILKKRDALDPAVRTSKSLLIQTALFALPEIVSSSCIMFYVSFRSEVQTETMIKHALAIGKTVIVPITDLKNKRLVLSRLENYDEDLAPGTWGILEPRPEKVRPVSYADIDSVIAPGAAFTEDGWRIGYGGGFFDRLLRESKKKAVALAFEMQILDTIPHDPERDVPVNYVITERRVITCASMR